MIKKWLFLIGKTDELMPFEHDTRYVLHLTEPNLQAFLSWLFL